MGTAHAWLATFNTALIVISGACISVGYFFIRHRRVRPHQWSMITGAVFAAPFLGVYVTRALLFETKMFAGEGLVRPSTWAFWAPTPSWPSRSVR